MKISRKKIEVKMAEHGLSVADVAKMLGVTRQNIFLILKRGTCIRRTAENISNVLGCTIEDITPSGATSIVEIQEMKQLVYGMLKAMLSEDAYQCVCSALDMLLAMYELNELEEDKT